MIANMTGMYAATQADGSQYADAGGKRAGRIGTVVAGHRGGVDLASLVPLRRKPIGDDADNEVGDEADDHEAQGLFQLAAGQARPALRLPSSRSRPAGRSSTLIDCSGNSNGTLRSGTREAHVEEQQQGLEQIVPKVVPERTARISAIALPPIPGIETARCFCLPPDTPRAMIWTTSDGDGQSSLGPPRPVGHKTKDEQDRGAKTSL